MKVKVKMTAVKMRKRERNPRNPVRKRKENLTISPRKGQSYAIVYGLNCTVHKSNFLARHVMYFTTLGLKNCSLKSASLFDFTCHFEPNFVALMYLFKMYTS